MRAFIAARLLASSWTLAAQSGQHDVVIGEHIKAVGWTWRRYAFVSAALCVSLLSSAGALRAATQADAAHASSAGYAELEDARIYYETAGKGSPVVLIHGNVGDQRHWNRQFIALAEAFRVIRYDVRGYGRSSLPSEDAPYSDHEDLAALLDRLGVAKAHLVGWSMGSAIAIDFAIRFPERHDVPHGVGTVGRGLLVTDSR